MGKQKNKFFNEDNPSFETLFETLLDNISDYVYFKDKDLKFIKINAKATEAIGLENPNEAIGKTEFDFFTKKTAETSKKEEKKILETGKPLVNKPRKIKFSDGSIHWIESTKIPIYNKNKEISGIAGISKDITDWMDLEEKLHKKNIELKKNEEKLKVRLESILSPEHEIGSEEFKDIIDVDAIQSLMDEFYKLTNIGMAIVDMNGNVLVKTGWQDICTKFHRVNKKTQKNCIESDLFLSKNVKPGEYLTYKCKNHMWDIATPIMIGKKRVGTFFLGQFFYKDEKIDYNFFEKQAEKYGFDKKKYLAALDRVPRWSREKVDNVMKFYSKFTMLISLLSYSNYRQAKIIEERKKIEKELRESEETARVLLNSPVDSIVLLKKKGEIVDFNNTIAKTVNKEREDLIGNIIWDYFPANVSKKRKKKVDEVFKTGKTVRFTDKNNGLWYDTSIKPIFVSKKTPQMVLVTARDITKQKKAERKLIETESKLRSLVETSNEFIWQVDKNGVYNYVSDNVSEVVGYKKSEILGKTPFDFMEKTEAERVGKLFSKIVEKKEKITDLVDTWIHKNGKKIIFETNATPLFDDENNFVGYFGVCKNITPRKKAERELNLTLDATTEGIWSWNFKTEKMFFSNRYYTMLGYKPQEFKPTYENWVKLIHPDDRKKALTVAEKYLKNKPDLYENEFRLKTKNGDYRWIQSRAKVVERDSNDEAVRMIGNHNDITEKKIAEKNISDLKDFYGFILDKIPNGIWVTDQNDKMVYFNSGMEKISGIKSEQAIGLDVTKDFKPETTKIFLKSYRKAKKNKKPQKYEAEVVTPKGKLTIQTGWLTPRLKNGKYNGMICTAEDITKQKKDEEKLKENEKRLREVEKIGKIGHVKWDVKQNKAFWSDEIYELYEQEKKLGPPSYDEIMNLHQKKDAKKLEKLVKNAMENAEPYETDLKAKLPSGKLVYFHIRGKPIKDKNGKVVSSNGTVQDITERKKNEERLKRFFNLSTDLVCEAELKTGNFTKLNPAFKKILGFSNKELIGKSFYDIIHPEDIEKTETFIHKKLKHGKKIFSVTVRFKTKSNSYKWIEWNVQVLNKQGFIYGIGRDITEWKKQEQMLKKQMMKYDIEEGNTYLVKEKTLNKSIKAYNDLLDIGYNGLIFSRALKKDFLKNINHNSKHIWLSDTKLENSIKPKTSKILSKIKNQKEKTVIFFDRLDYIISKNNFEKTLDLIQKTREIAILNNLIVIFSVDTNLLDSTQLSKIEKETTEIETITKQRLTKDLQQIIEYIHKQNILGLFPKYKDLENEMNISKPTLRNKLRWLVKNNYIIEHKTGRSKNLEVTDKSRNLFL